MNMETWIVTTRMGEEWGCIKRLILDSATKQISHADVVVAGTGDIIRIPWDKFEIQEEGFRLTSAHRDVEALGGGRATLKPTGAVAMDLWP